MSERWVIRNGMGRYRTVSGTWAFGQSNAERFDGELKRRVGGTVDIYGGRWVRLIPKARHCICTCSGCEKIEVQIRAEERERIAAAFISGKIQIGATFAALERQIVGLDWPATAAKSGGAK